MSDKIIVDLFPEDIDAFMKQPVLESGPRTQRKSTIGKPGPPIDEKRERMRHVQVEEEKEKGIYEYMRYRRQKLIRKKIEFMYRDLVKHPEKNDGVVPKKPNFTPLHRPPLTPEVMKVKAERRAQKQQILEIINQGVGDTMRKARLIFKNTRPEYISNTVMMSFDDKLVIQVLNTINK